jgi:hypothetical protein
MFSTINQAVTIPDDSFFQAHRRFTPSMHYHFVFKAQPESILNDWRESFHRFIAYCVHVSGGSIITIDGADQTVKLRVVLSPTSAPDEFARRLKILSASWARRKTECRHFAWLENYEAITLDPHQTKNVDYHLISN